MRTHMLVVVFVAAVAVAGVKGQTPQPFPRPGGALTPSVAAPSPAGQASPERATPQPPPAGQPLAQAPAPPPVQAPPATAAAGIPAMPVPIYPTAQYLTSFDAGSGQRYYLFGATASFADLVAYYRTQLNNRGNLVFEEPPTHMFDIGRFRSESMAFPPSLTIKDWTFNGSQGYPNPQPGAQPARFPTIIMIVPAPAGAEP